MSDAKTTSLLRLTSEDVALFAEASHDHNSLHVSAEYARRTAFGRPVVHGMLGVLACLGRLSPGALTRLSRVTVDFKGPLFTDVAYDVVAEARRDGASARVQDGGRLLMKMTVTFEPGVASEPEPSGEARIRATPANLSFDALPEGTTRTGNYSVVPTAFRALLDCWGIGPERGVGARQAAVLMALSYLVGMETPGERALFARAEVEFLSATGATATNAPLAYRLDVRESDPRFDLIRMDVAFEAGALAARSSLEVYVRSVGKSVDLGALRGHSPPGAALHGKAALVVGGSRGLGAAISIALADQGCNVALAYAESAASAAGVASVAPDRIVPLRADATDSETFARAAHGLTTRRGGLDVLVCNACPPLQALPLGPASVTRIGDYLARSFSMAAIPLAATLEALEERQGTLVVISSSAVLDPPPDWPHYAAAKGALEGLARAVAARGRVRVVIARPGRIDTDLMNTPGPKDALPPELVAARIVAAILSAAKGAPGRRPFVLDSFAPGPSASEGIALRPLNADDSREAP